MDCWHRYDENFVPDAKHVAAAMREQGGDEVWYVDSGATDHVTSELEQLALREQYAIEFTPKAMEVWIFTLVKPLLIPLHLNVI